MNSRIARVCLLGADGMLGHELLCQLAVANGIILTGTCRSERSRELLATACNADVVSNIDASNVDGVFEILSSRSIDIVINCIGVVKQKSLPASTYIYLNSLFPVLLSEYCEANEVKLIHVSTDCVFSGSRGFYSESDNADASDLYGLSKRLGESLGDSALVLRTSIIGYELWGSKRGLLEWFMAQNGVVSGYKSSIFSGLTTRRLAEIIKTLILRRDSLQGLYHVGSAPISKYDLLTLLNRHRSNQVDLMASSEMVCDRSLNSLRFYTQTGIGMQRWSDMIQDYMTEGRRFG